ncbi:MAG: hypothetical protein EXS10_03405 [Phycisphaerales bacterium]|nr:hypothetical protein [Phycisphaerales bacterium]
MRVSPRMKNLHCVAQVCALGFATLAFAGGPVDESRATPPAVVETPATAAAIPVVSTPVVATPSKGRPLGLAPSAAASTTKEDARTIPADENGLFATVLPTAGALAAVLLAILGAKWCAQRLGIRLGNGRRPSGVVEILARYPVAKGQQVMLMKVARRVLVVHQCGDGMRTLAELSSAEEVADVMARIEAGDRVAKDPRFEASLQSALKGDLRGSARGYSATESEDFESVETIDLTRKARTSSRDGSIPNTAAIRRGLFGGRLA